MLLIIFFQVPADPVPEEKLTFTRRLSTYELLLMQISKYDKNKLRKASTVNYKHHIPRQLSSAGFQFSD